MVNTHLHGLTCWGRYECLLHLLLQNRKRTIKSTTKPSAKKSAKPNKTRNQKENLVMNSNKKNKKKKTQALAFHDADSS